MKIKVTKDNIETSMCCKECGFYNDCPMDYACPPMEIVEFIATEAEKGRLKILMREDLTKEMEEEE